MAVSTVDDLAAHSLELVNRELAATLDAARRELEEFVDGHAGRDALLKTADLLHLARGALKIVEIHGAALLAEEMEQTCRVLVESGEDPQSDPGVEALTRAMVQLPAYLERLLNGGKDVALVLLPLLNDLREARGKPSLSEGTLVLLNTGPFEKHLKSAAVPSGEIVRGFEKVAQRLRPAFQTALLGWIRGADPERNLNELLRVSINLERGATTDQVKQLWSVLTAVLTAIGSGGLEATVTLKRLIGQADRQLKRLIDSGESSFMTSPPVDLLNSLLYYVARADTNDAKVQAVRETYGLSNVLPGEEQIEKAREGLAGPSVKLMRTVAAAIKEDLGAVKDALDIFVRTGMQQVDKLAPQLEMLKKISDTLGVLGLEKARGQIQAQTQQLQTFVASNKPVDVATLEKTAAVLLDVEDDLDRELVRAVVPGDGEARTDGDVDSDKQQRHVTQAVMGECIVNLAKVKEAVVQLVDHPGDTRALDQVKPQLRGITAGLLMLSKTKAVKVVERVGQVIATRLAPSSAKLKPDHLERLADAIVSVEYYMETVSSGRADPWYMLDNADRCLELLERLPAVKATRPVAEAPPPPPPPKPAARKPSVMEVDQERSDPELVELFIEEAKEELANIRRHLPAWLENLDNSEALISVRRAFHTLKGSGRMVGAQLVAEFSWSLENLLNRLINQTLEVSPAMLAFIQEAVKALPQLIEQLEVGLPPKTDVHLLMQQAEAYAEGDPDAESLTGQSLRLPALQETDGSPGEPASSMDPVLADIFVKELRGHVKVLRDYARAARVRSEAPPVDEPLYRASHTLLGSARMANFAPAMALAAPLTEHLHRHYESGTGLNPAGLQALEATASEIAAMADALAAGRAYVPNESLPAQLEALAPIPAPIAERADETPATAPASFDPEIAAIFVEEAAEILDNAELALQAVRQSDDVSAVVELQRLVHTLKGGARMAGVVAMGDLSHALETLLSSLGSGRAKPGTSAIELIQRSLDTLQQMRDSIDAGRTVDATPGLIAELEGLDRGPLSAAAPARAPTAAPRLAPTPAAEPESPDEELPADAAASAEVTAIDLDEFESIELTAADIAELDAIDLDSSDAGFASIEPPDVHPAVEEPIRATEEESAPAPAAPHARAAATAAVESRAAERAETARVDAALLDALLNNAGEINIFQSRLNQQLHSIDFHLGELGATVSRLRDQLRKLEAETEAQILHRHQDDPEAEGGFDPLELDRYSTIQQLSRALAESASDVASINELLQGLTNETDTLLTQQARVTSELQDGLMQTRMVPFHRHVARLARIVRQACADARKSAELVVEGENSELDRQVLENMLPPFEHLLRNAIVHGIESPAVRKERGKPGTGKVFLKLKREGSEVIIEVADDGGGLDLQAIRRKAVEQGLLAANQKLTDQQAVELILQPGFSTAGELTQTAGRGVGMDVVDNEIKKLGGSMRIESKPGQGTRFVIRLPYTLAITHALIVNVGEETFALPLPTVEGITRLSREKILQHLTEDEPKLDYGGITYRIQHLGSLVGAAPSALPEEENAVSLVLVRAGESSTALLMDSLEGSREIVVKTLGPHIASVPGVTGATILGDGRVIMILDPGTLVRGQKSAEPAAHVATPPTRQLTALVVDDSITMRRVTQRLLERRGVKVLTARDGLDAITVLQDHEADVILLDIEMPRMDGYQFATHVRNDPKLKDLPIIMITSRSGEKHRAKAIEIGVNDYLSKPYQEGALIAAIEALIGREL
jgi:chemosensory pili system protein ChpA (sensor histidine kinase/response regulator)